MTAPDSAPGSAPNSVRPYGAGVAVLSDIHAVLPALEAVLAEPDVRAADRIVLTGDLLAGPLPRQTLARLRAVGDRAVWISGNADREMAAARPGNEPGDPMDAWAAGHLGPDEREFLGSLPATVTLEVAGLGPVLFCHATPRDDTEIALVDSRPERWAEVLAGVPDAVRTVVCGHTHMPFVRFTHGRLVVNPGSIGMPYGRPGAHWALLGPGGGAVTLRHTAFDHEAACARIARESDSPSAAAWADTYVRARCSAEEALAAFGPGDGRNTAPGTDG
ncbi:metallophosphoesterase family protein [Streptomyces sp. RPA4-5]|uniref:metallophosphoesterase family protein n=1 Tax=Streptomyces sp. RPA4-5 TaxID=2721245 RepID=UPI002001DCE8|nr:metallophosphoesterase family protein [Streptomyces sp. RPA4-5]